MSSTRTTGTCRVHLSDIVFRMRRFAKLSSSERKTEEIYHFVFHQSHISEKNMDRLRILLDDPDEAVRNMAYVLIRVAAIRPYKRKRLKYLVKVDRTLAKEFVDVFLAGEWIDVEHDDYDEGLSFEAPGGGDRSIQVKLWCSAKRLRHSFLISNLAAGTLTSSFSPIDRSGLSPGTAPGWTGMVGGSACRRRERQAG